MNQLKQALKDLEQKYEGRIKRGKVLLDMADQFDVSETEIEKMIERQITELRTWSVDELIKEFVDVEELIIREALRSMC